MRRRDFIALGGAAVVLGPIEVEAQQTSKPVVGYLSGLAPDDRPFLVDAFRRGLAVAGYIEGQNVTIEYRYANNQPDRLPALVSELIARRVNVIASTGGNRVALAAKSLTSSIPIVFTTGFDPVKGGFVSNLGHPDENVTGVSWFTAELAQKHLELMSELVPRLASVAVFINPDSPEGLIYEQTAREAARTLSLSLLVLTARTDSEIDEGFSKLSQQGVRGAIIGADPFLSVRAKRIVALSARAGIPTIYANREFAEVGGLLSYGNNVADAYRRAGIYTGRILNGDKPGNLPVDRATKFELVLNVKTAKELGLEVPLSLQMRIDEVID